MVMTGRDLIIYILQNNLEDTPFYEDGKLLGFMTETEAAVKFNVGIASIWAWYHLNQIDGVIIGDRLYIPEHAKCPISKEEVGNE